MPIKRLETHSMSWPVKPFPFDAKKEKIAITEMFLVRYNEKYAA